MAESFNKTREELKRIRECIKNKSVNLDIHYEDEVVNVAISKNWNNWQGMSVDVKELDIKSPDATVTAMRAKKGTFLEPHFHVQAEIIYVVSGKIKETVEGSTFKTGEVLKISPRALHAISFLEDSMLIVQWIPKLEA